MKEKNSSLIRMRIERIEYELTKKAVSIEALFTDEKIESLMDKHNIPLSYFSDFKPMLLEGVKDFLEYRLFSEHHQHIKKTIAELDHIEKGVRHALSIINTMDVETLEELFQEAEGGRHELTPSYLLDRYASLTDKSSQKFTDFHKARTGYQKIVETFENLENLHDIVRSKIKSLERDKASRGKSDCREDSHSVLDLLSELLQDRKKQAA